MRGTVLTVIIPGTPCSVALSPVALCTAAQCPAAVLAAHEHASEITTA
jgi:hypothetical protein